MKKLKTILILGLLLLISLGSALAQERLWISDKSYIIVRDDFAGFNKVNDSTYVMQDMDAPCLQGDKTITIDGISTFASMPCFRDYLLSQPNKIVVWGKLKTLGVGDTFRIYNWQKEVIGYHGKGWAGAAFNEPPYGGCKCTFSPVPGDSLLINFIGNGIQVWGEKNDHENTADIYIDHKKVATVNEYDSVGFGNKQILMYENLNLPYSFHTLKIVVTGNDTRATGKYFVLHNVKVFHNDNSVPPISQTNSIDTVFIHTTDTVFIPKDTVRINHFYIPEINADTLDNPKTGVPVYWQWNEIVK